MILLLERLSEPALYADPEHRCRAGNAAWARCAKAPSGAALAGLHLRALIGAGGYDALLAALDRLSRGEVVGVEAGGEVQCPRSLTCAADLAPDGRLQGLYVMGEAPAAGEPSERARLEEALRETRALAERRLAELEAIYASAPIGLCVVDADLRYTRINERLAALNGRPASAHLGRTLREVLPDLADAIAPAYQHVLATGEPLLDVEGSGPHPAARAEVMHWTASYYPLKAPDGRVAGVNVAVGDISERKRIEEALRESEQRFAAFSDHSPVPAFLKDAAGVYVYANQASAAVLGRTPAELCGRIDDELFGPEDARRLREDDLAVLDSGRAMEFRETLFSTGGVPRHYQVVKFRIQADGKAYVGGIALDITEREQLLAAERVARAEAERADRTKNEFLATLSHELRTPLSAILGYVQMLRGGQLRPERVGRALEIIERNARVQSEIVADLLDMNRIMAGKLQLDLGPADLEPIVDAAVDSVRESAEAKGIRIEVEVARLPSPVLGDQARLQQVLWNLLANAIKFTPRGGSVAVTVRPDGDAVEVRVADTGEGIEGDFLPHVFDRFRQANASTSRQHRGLGLGLAICKQLVEMHRGAIRAESPGPGRGAVFTVRFPAAATAADPSGRAAPGGAGAPGAGLRGVRALVVDDETDARELVRELLEAQGVVVRAAASAAEALAAVEEEVPQVVISDIGMPFEDGYTLMRKVRSLPPERGGLVPAVALTAFARPEDQARAREAGYQHHLSKPIDAGQLFAVVADLVAGRAEPTGPAPR